MDQRGQRDFVNQSLLVPVVPLLPVNILEPVVPVNILESVNYFIPVDFFGTSEYFGFCEAFKACLFWFRLLAVFLALARRAEREMVLSCNFCDMNFKSLPTLTLQWQCL